MENIINFIQNILFVKTSQQKIGLSQFKETPATLPKKEVSIKNKDIKLSYLMRRVS